MQVVKANFTYTIHEESRSWRTGFSLFWKIFHAAHCILTYISTIQKVSVLQVHQITHLTAEV